MNSEKKLTVKRLVIFLLFSFIPFMIIVPIMWAYYGEPIYASENEELAAPIYLLGVFGMMIPSLANLFTRVITGEGFKNTYLGLYCKGKMGYYIASAAVKLIEAVVLCVVIWALFFGEMSFSEMFSELNIERLGLFLLQFAFSIIIFFPAFGEEWGWRGYMMPKLLEIMPKPAAVIVGGVIWGLWHAPLTVAGHNFGVDYAGYPWLGILYMCIMCVTMNAFLTLLTEKTRSIYPAAFCHAVNNNLSFGVLLSLFAGEETVQKAASLGMEEMMLPNLLILGITGAVSFLLFIKKDTAAGA